MRIYIIILLFIISINPSFSQNSFANLANSDKYKKGINVEYGNQTIIMNQESSHFDYLSQKRESIFSSKELSGLKIKLVSEITYLNDHLVLQHQIELSSANKLEQNLTVFFPVRSLDRFDKIMMPLKNGVIYESGKTEDTQIASYRCAGKPEKYTQDIALPMVICTKDEKGTAVLTDPYFTSLYDKGIIRWTYPKEVGLEDSIERRTIIEIEGVSSIDEGMNM